MQADALCFQNLCVKRKKELHIIRHLADDLSLDPREPMLAEMGKLTFLCLSSLAASIRAIDNNMVKAICGKVGRLAPQCNAPSCDSMLCMACNCWQLAKDGLHALLIAIPRLFQDVAGCIQSLMWHQDQKSVSPCLIVLMQRAQT